MSRQLFQKKSHRERYKVRDDEKKIFWAAWRMDLNPRTAGALDSKPKRRERVYKRAEKAQRELFRKRRRSGMSAPVALQKTPVRL